MDYNKLQKVNNAKLHYYAYGSHTASKTHVSDCTIFSEIELQVSELCEESPPRDFLVWC